MRPTLRRGLQTSEHRIALLIGDLVVTSFGVVFGLWVWTITAGGALSVAFVAERAYWFLVVPAWLVALTPAYGLKVALSVGRTLWALVQAAATLLVLYLVVYFYAPREELPRLMAVYAIWEAAFLTFGWRLVYIWLFTETALRRRILVFGAGEAGRVALRLLREHGMKHAVVVGFLDDDTSKHEANIDGVKVLAGHDQLARIVGDLHVSEIILAVTHGIGDEALRALIKCQERGIELVRMTTVYEDVAERVPVEHLESDWLVTSFIDAVRAKDASRAIKRAIDVVGSLVGLTVFLVVWPFVAVAVWLDTGWPVLYRQVRVGRANSKFALLKFRTMGQDAEEDGPRVTEPGDSRITAVGRVLRRTRIDELPQALNVLRGEMSLVGPRPEQPEIVESLEKKIPFYRTRSIVRPGLTGWAQVNLTAAESTTGPLAKLEYDLYYIKHRSLLFDLRIMLRTLRTVLSLKGH